MSAIPETSTTLLRELSRDSQHVRWGEFVVRYRPMMEVFMRERFPGVDAEEAIQRTFVALAKALPSYIYSPEGTGAFHNYLTGILRHRALRIIDEERRQAALRAALAEAPPAQSAADDEERAEWRKSLFEVALCQYLADGSVKDRTKQIFIRVAVNGESPEAVAESLGMRRNAVDQIKSRARERLRELVKALEEADNE